MQRCYNLDSLKFLCAVLIVFLHTYTPYQECILPLTRCAVPCFFIVSGYLMYSADRLHFAERLRRGVKRMLRILLWSTLLFAVVKFLFAFKTQDFSFIRWKPLIEFVLFNENPFGFHLWYLGAYLYTLVFFLVLVRTGKLKWTYWFIPCLLLIDLCFGKYSIALWHREFPYIYVRNFLCVGIPYFSIGLLISRHKECILSRSYMQILTMGGVILFSLTSIVENRLLVELNMNATRDHYISSTFLAVCLFLCFLGIKQSKANFVSRLGEKESLYIYIFHPLLLMFFSVASRYLPLGWKEFYLYAAPMIVLLMTIAFTKAMRAVKIVKS